MAACLRELIDGGQKQLADLSDSARLDTELLLCHAMAVARSYLHAHPEEPITTDAEQYFQQLLARRVAGEPVAHLRGEAEFWSLPLEVTADTLIPRPETELLVELALERIPEKEAWQLADLGTGTGAIALALAKERPRSQILAMDLSVAALAVAGRNLQQLDIKNVELRHSNWFSAVNKNEYFHLVVSNPPYIAEGDPHLEQGDVRFDPSFALVSGKDGLDDIRLLIEKAPAHLLPGGWLMIEHGYNQGGAVVELFSHAGFSEVENKQDLAGQPRVTLGQFNPGSRRLPATHPGG